MKSLDWSTLVASFFEFRKRADKINFYTEDLDKMEESLMQMKPIEGLDFKDVTSDRKEYR